MTSARIARWTLQIGTVAAALAALILPSDATAQSTAPTSPAISVSAGASQVDLSGTGTAPMVAIRADVPMGRFLLIEGGVGLARPDQQFGARTTFVVPELQLQFQLPIGPVMPYLGVGGGMAMDFRPDYAGGAESDVTVSGAGGLRWCITPRVGARAELRRRGIGDRFTASAAEWTAGLAWRL